MRTDNTMSEIETIIFKMTDIFVDWNEGGDSSGISKNWRPWTEQREGSGWSLARGKRPLQWNQHYLFVYNLKSPFYKHRKDFYY